MKKLAKFITLFLTAFAVVSFSSCAAKPPKGDLKTSIDTLSYAAGIASTQGLMPYLEQQGITEEYIGDFVQGFLAGSKIDEKDKKALANALGFEIGKNISIGLVSNLNNQAFGPEDTVSTINKDQVLAGFLAIVTKENLLIDESEANVIADTEIQKLQSKRNEVYKEENLAFLEKNKTKKGVVTLPSGLQYEVITEGTGPKPTAENIVVVDYVGTNIHGQEFDSSISREERAEFPLNQVIQGWIEGIQLMPVGSKYKFYIPYDLAYGEMERSEEIGPYATLIFEVELYEIK